MCASSAYLHDHLLVKFQPVEVEVPTHFTAPLLAPHLPSFGTAASGHSRLERANSRASKTSLIGFSLSSMFRVHVASDYSQHATVSSLLFPRSSFSFPSVVAFSGITSVVFSPTLPRLANRLHILSCVFQTPYSLLPFPRPSTNRRGAPAMKRSTHRYQS